MKDATQSNLENVVKFAEKVANATNLTKEHMGAVTVPMRLPLEVAMMLLDSVKEISQETNNPDMSSIETSIVSELFENGLATFIRDNRSKLMSEDLPPTTLLTMAKDLNSFQISYPDVIVGFFVQAALLSKSFVVMKHISNCKSEEERQRELLNFKMAVGVTLAKPVHSAAAEMSDDDQFMHELDSMLEQDIIEILKKFGVIIPSGRKDI